MRKFKIIADFEKEEHFLNDMAEKGYYLEKYNSLGVYTFRRIEPQKLSYRIDFRTFSNNAQFENYCTLFQDAGWEHVYGTRRSGSQYFLPIPGKAQTDDIFSDKKSKAGRYRRFSKQCGASLLWMIVWLMLLQPSWSGKTWYFTALRNMPGSLLWKAVLFETPFIILCAAPAVVLFLLAALYGYWALKARNLYKEA
jgi:hypothetical protein